MQKNAPINNAQPINWSHPFNRGLISWWLTTPNGQGGVTFYDLARRNNGTLTNMTPVSDWSGNTHPGGFASLDLDGTNDFVSVTDSPSLSGPAALTISAWIRVESYPTAFAPIVTKGMGTTGSREYSLNIRGSDSLLLFQVAQESTANVKNLFGVTAITSNTWFWVGATWDGATQIVYRSGLNDGSQAAALTIEDGTANLRMGHDNDDSGGASSDYFDGQVDDIRIYNRALSAA